MSKPTDEIVESTEVVEVVAEPTGPFDGVPDDHIRVPLAHHWQDPDTEVWHLPGDLVVTRISTARSLLAAGFLAINPTDHAAVSAAFGRYRP